jgi:hypothetical protein
MDEKRIIDAFAHLGISKEWLQTGKGNIQTNKADVNSGIQGIQGDGNKITGKSQGDGTNKQAPDVGKSIRFYLEIFLVIVICAFIFWFLAVMSYTCFGFALSPDNVVVTLVGILATFVVISNYMQVRDVKGEFESKLGDAKRDFENRVRGINSMVEALNTRIDLLATSNSKIDTSTYQILGIDHTAVVENWYVLVKNIPARKEELAAFVKGFRSEYCKKASNINLIDTADVYPLIKKYPLEGKEYISVADHFIAVSSFEDVDTGNVWMYPFQDIKYKEYGGNNWKKPSGVG